MTDISAIGPKEFKKTKEVDGSDAVQIWLQFAIEQAWTFFRMFFPCNTKWFAIHITEAVVTLSACIV